MSLCEGIYIVGELLRQVGVTSLFGLRDKEGREGESGDLEGYKGKGGEGEGLLEGFMERYDHFVFSHV